MGSAQHLEMSIAQHFWLGGQESTLEPGQFHKPTGRFDAARRFKGARHLAWKKESQHLKELDFDTKKPKDPKVEGLEVYIEVFIHIPHQWMSLRFHPTSDWFPEQTPPDLRDRSYVVWDIGVIHRGRNWVFKLGDQGLGYYEDWTITCRCKKSIPRIGSAQLQARNHIYKILQLRYGNFDQPAISEAETPMGFSNSQEVPPRKKVEAPVVEKDPRKRKAAKPASSGPQGMGNPGAVDFWGMFASGGWKIFLGDAECLKCLNWTSWRSENIGDHPRILHVAYRSYSCRWFQCC